MFGSWKRPAAFGLWNLTTLVGLYIALRCAKAELGRSAMSAEEQKHWRRWYLFLFSVIFVMLTIAVEVPLLGPLRIVEGLPGGGG